jgi:hypothetical protein
MSFLQSINTLNFIILVPTFYFLAFSVYISNQLFSIFMKDLVFLNDKNTQTKTINTISTSESTGSGETPNDNNETPIEKLKRQAKQDSDNFVFVLQVIVGVVISICVIVFLNKTFGGAVPGAPGIDTFSSKVPIVDPTISKVVTETGDCCKAAVETLKIVVPPEPDFEIEDTPEFYKWLA